MSQNSKTFYKNTSAKLKLYNKKFVLFAKFLLISFVKIILFVTKKISSIFITLIKNYFYKILVAYFGVFGIATGRYELAAFRLDNQVNNLIMQINKENFYDLSNKIGKIQNQKLPYQFILC